MRRAASSVSASIGAVYKPAGFDNGQGIISAAYPMGPLDPQWKDDPSMKAFDEFLAKDFSAGDRSDGSIAIWARERCDFCHMASESYRLGLFRSNVISAVTACAIHLNESKARSDGPRVWPLTMLRN
jgi:hypothetical protein